MDLWRLSLFGCCGQLPRRVAVTNVGGHAPRIAISNRPWLALAERIFGLMAQLALTPRWLTPHIILTQQVQDLRLGQAKISCLARRVPRRQVSTLSADSLRHFGQVRACSFDG